MELQSPRRELDRIDELDGVRGLAILIVLFHHLLDVGVGSGVHIVDRIVTLVSSEGWVGVDLFFVLSGFLITRILLASRENPHYFRNFYARRTLRIFPLYYLFLIAGLVIVPILIPATRGIVDREWMYWSYLSNYRMGEAPVPFGVLWSLAVEEQFYLVWPLLIYFSNRRVALGLCIALIILPLLLRGYVVLTGGDVGGIYMQTHFRTEGLAIGALLALLYGRLPDRAIFIAAVTGGMVSCGGLLITFALSHSRHISARGDRWYGLVTLFTFVSFAAAAVVAIAVTKRPRLFRTGILRFFGRYSYCIYLIHMPLLALWSWLFGAKALPTVGGMLLPAKCVVGLLIVLASVAVAVTSWNLFERHFLKLKAYFPEIPSARNPVTAELASTK